MRVMRAEPNRFADVTARSVGAVWRAYDLQLTTYAALPARNGGPTAIPHCSSNTARESLSDAIHCSPSLPSARALRRTSSGISIGTAIRWSLATPVCSVLTLVPTIVRLAGGRHGMGLLDRT